MNENGRNGGIIGWVRSGENYRLDDGQVWETSVPVWTEEIKDPNLISNALARQGIHSEIHGKQIAANTDRRGFWGAVMAILGL